MHGPAAAVLPPALALISLPYLSLAVIGALAVIVYEVRSLLRGLFSRSASSASQRTAKRPSPRRAAEAWQDARGLSADRDNTPDTGTAVPGGDRSAVRRAAPAIVVNASARQQPPEREPMDAAPPPYLRREVTARLDGASVTGNSMALVREGGLPWIEHDSTEKNVTTTDSAKGYPRRRDARQVTLMGGRMIELQTMRRHDRVPMKAFPRALPSRERLVLHADIRDRAAVDEWITSIESGCTLTTVAHEGNRLVGYASLVRGAAPSTRHVGEISIVVASDCPSIELGQCMAREIAAAALEVGLRKIVAVLTDDQTDARDIFTHLGLRPEALLADQVIDEEHRTYDLLIMSCAVDALVALPEELLAPAGARIETAARNGEDVRSGEPALVAASARDAVDAHPGTINAEESVATGSPALLPRRRTRPALIRRAYLAAVVLGAVLMLAFGAFYLTNRHARTRESHVLGESVQPTVPTRSGSAQAFESTRAGSGSVFLPMVRPATTVRVSVDPDVVGTWFWCVESSFGIPLAAHYCAASGSSDRVTGELIAEGVIHVDPSWPAYALYFVQMYCEGSCLWHVKVAPQ